MLLYKIENPRLMLNIFVGGVQTSQNGKINDFRSCQNVKSLNSYMLLQMR